MKLVIKNMVCPCCIMYVTDTLEKLNLDPSEVSLSGVTFRSAPSNAQLDILNERLQLAGLEIVREKKNMIVEKMKAKIRDLVSKDHDPLKINLSVYLSEELHYNYSYLSNLFSESEGQTIRDFGITLRIDRVKQMLVVEQLDLLEISIRLNYSSVSHLAAQFKKITGLTTSEYKKLHATGGPLERMIG